MCSSAMPFFLLITPSPPPTAHWGIQYSLRTGSGHTSGWQRWSTNHQRLLPKQPSLLKRVVSALAFIATVSFHLLSLETLRSFLTPLSLSPHIQSHSKSCQFCLRPMNKMSCMPIKIFFINGITNLLKIQAQRLGVLFLSFSTSFFLSVISEMFPLDPSPLFYTVACSLVLTLHRQTPCPHGKPEHSLY